MRSSGSPPSAAARRPLPPELPTIVLAPPGSERPRAGGLPAGGPPRHRSRRPDLPHRRRRRPAAARAAALDGLPSAGATLQAIAQAIAAERRRAMTLVKLAGGRIVDPANKRRGEVGDLYIRDGRIVADPGAGVRIDQSYRPRRPHRHGRRHRHPQPCRRRQGQSRAHADDRGPSRPPERRDGELRAAAAATPRPRTFITGYRYAELGYTAAFEPAMVPATPATPMPSWPTRPMIDKGCYVMLGNDDVLLAHAGRTGAAQTAINDYVAWMLRATQALGVKVVNPGGISAFKFNSRELGLDSAGPHYGVTPRRIVAALARAVHELGVAHPLHLHCNNLGVPGNLETTLRPSRRPRARRCTSPTCSSTATAPRATASSRRARRASPRRVNAQPARQRRRRPDHVRPDRSPPPATP